MDKNDRTVWLEAMHKIAYPIIYNAANGRLHEVLPLSESEKNRGVAYLEAIGRTLCGISAWLELDEKEISNERERTLHAEYLDLAKRTVANAVDPESKDFCIWNRSENNTVHDQPLVDAAFFSSALIKATNSLWDSQSDETKNNIIACLKKSLKMRPCKSNWLMFTATIESFLYKVTGTADATKIDYALEMHRLWYKGDGVYGDGESLAVDYYNSYVIQPMLEEVTRTAAAITDGRYREMIEKSLPRYCALLERMTAPDGSFAPLGRSITYRTGAFHALAHASLVGMLPEQLPANQVRCALTKVIKKVMSAPDLFDENGFLTKGLYGKQESLAEGYINVGSEYLALFIFLPLGLPEKHLFWSGESVKTTWERIWSGENIAADHSI